MAIMDADGKLLGTVRTDLVQSGNTAIQFRPHPRHRYQEVDVTDELLRKPAEELHRGVKAKLTGKQ
jgi:hypothetical protein